MTGGGKPSAPTAGQTCRTCVARVSPTIGTGFGFRLLPCVSIGPPWLGPRVTCPGPTHNPDGRHPERHPGRRSSARSDATFPDRRHPSAVAPNGSPSARTLQRKAPICARWPDLDRAQLVPAAAVSVECRFAWSPALCVRSSRFVVEREPLRRNSGLILGSSTSCWTCQRRAALVQQRGVAAEWLGPQISRIALTRG